MPRIGLAPGKAWTVCDVRVSGWQAGELGEWRGGTLGDGQDWRGGGGGSRGAFRESPYEILPTLKPAQPRTHPFSQPERVPIQPACQAAVSLWEIVILFSLTLPVRLAFGSDQCLIPRKSLYAHLGERTCHTASICLYDLGPSSACLIGSTSAIHCRHSFSVLKHCMVLPFHMT